MEAMNRDKVTRQRAYSAPIEQVWLAISTGEQISAWFIQADFEARVGYRYTFTHEDTKIIGEVLEVKPMHHLVYTWEIEGTGIPTTVKWTLEETAKVTVVTVEHSGIEAYPTDEKVIAMFEDYSGGWANCFNQLEKYLSA
ncbi:MAG: SRPBCC domain-containing protein [Cryomorphaceae bacterium]